jgi:hypothetical protein
MSEPCKNQKAETTLLILQLTYERNERLANYIQLTNTGIFGFLGIISIEVVKSGVIFCSIQLFVFLIVIIISMLAWRWIVYRYQDSIIEGYIKILNCENESIIEIPDKITFKHAFTEKMNLSSDIDDNKLITYLRNDYQDPNHLKLDYVAGIFISISLVLILFISLICRFVCE